MQEHAEGARSQPPIICQHCGATNPRTATICEACEKPLSRPSPDPKTEETA